MKSIFKEHGTIILSAVGGTTILLAAFVANGTQFEDAWLYITGLWIVLIPLSEMFFKKSKKK